jgi:quercetin dioxygenase-like cupin family protein
MLATGSMGAEGLSTALASFHPGTRIPYHTHPTSEVITVVAGEARVFVEGRRYRLRPFDCMNVPAGAPHSLLNESTTMQTVLHTTFPSATPARDMVPDTFTVVDRDGTDASCPEYLMRFDQAEVYELAPRAFFRDLFARRFGSQGVCGGYGIFEPGASLPCHFHLYDESITIVSGSATCQVAGREYTLSNNGTACIPKGRPHRFLNRGEQPMAMIWVYAGDEPERTLVDAGLCDGRLAFA